MLTIKTDNGHHRNYAIQIENHSKIDAEVRCITLWSQGEKVSKPAFRPDNANWSVPAQRTIPIQFDAQEDVAQRLWQLAGYPEDVDLWSAKIPFNGFQRIVTLLHSDRFIGPPRLHLVDYR